MRFLGKRADLKTEPELEVCPGLFMELVIRRYVSVNGWAIRTRSIHRVRLLTDILVVD